MSNLNHVTVSGRLGADAELKFLPSGTPVINFNLAINDYAGKDKDEYTNWIECTVFNKEKLVNFLKKGMKISASGKLRQSRWENESGEKRSKIGLILNEIELPLKNENAESYQGGYEPTDDDIPF